MLEERDRTISARNASLAEDVRQLQAALGEYEARSESHVRIEDELRSKTEEMTSVLSTVNQLKEEVQWGRPARRTTSLLTCPYTEFAAGPPSWGHRLS